MRSVRKILRLLTGVNNNKNSKHMRYWIILTGLVVIVIVTPSILALFRYDSIQFHAVQGTSMSPEYRPGDLVIAVRDEPNMGFDDFKKGDVIVFETHDPEFQPHNTTIHRVMGSYIEPDTGGIIKSLITKGDNNAIAEPLLDYPIYEEDVLGKVVLKVPWVALPRTWIQGGASFNTTDTLPTQQQMEEAFDNNK